MSMLFAGIEIVFSEYALEAGTERNFPESRNRSKRIHKKLVKRFGGEFRKVPCMWKIGGRIVAHPSFREPLERELRAAAKPDRGPPFTSPWVNGRPIGLPWPS